MHSNRQDKAAPFCADSVSDGTKMQRSFPSRRRSSGGSARTFGFHGQRGCMPVAATGARQMSATVEVQREVRLNVPYSMYVWMHAGSGDRSEVGAPPLQDPAPAPVCAELAPLATNHPFKPFSRQPRPPRTAVKRGYPAPPQALFDSARDQFLTSTPCSCCDGRRRRHQSFPVSDNAESGDTIVAFGDPDHATQ